MKISEKRIVHQHFRRHARPNTATAAAHAPSMSDGSGTGTSVTTLFNPVP
jgi:hypothetical protein